MNSKRRQLRAFHLDPIECRNSRPFGLDRSSSLLKKKSYGLYVALNWCLNSLGQFREKKAVLSLLLALAVAQEISRPSVDLSKPASPPLPRFYKGDEWAEVFIDTNSQGYPTGCSIGRTNVPRSRRYDVCFAMLHQLKIRPKDTAGNPTARRQRVIYIEPGKEREAIEKAAAESKAAGQPQAK